LLKKFSPHLKSVAALPCQYLSELSKNKTVSFFGSRCIYERVQCFCTPLGAFSSYMQNFINNLTLSVTAAMFTGR